MKHYFTPKTFDNNDEDFDFCAICGKNFRDKEQHIIIPIVEISDHTEYNEKRGNLNVEFN